ncbi:phosphatase PAP2 family protein [Sutcliffiella halmapala]|uniref:phosphatase PAP2 family protein n=1 Tax=Sutcliffiella halmapala TaxID=79882 RepID=UPI000994CD27|nr:phosphatase PAP2 family protein [Sutcliffiella halmapala]
MQAEKAQRQEAIPKFRTWSRLSFFILCGLFFFWSFQQIVAENTIAFDAAIRNAVNGWELIWLVNFFHLFTTLGDKTGVIIVMLLSIVFIWWKAKDYIAMGILVGGVIIVNELNKWLKDFTGRERPMTGPGAESLSFPSGHAMIGLFFYGLLVYYLLTYLKTCGRRLLVLISGIIFIFLLGTSRIFLNYHYPSDVLAGYAAGYLCLLVGILLYERLHYFFGKKTV